MKKILSIILGLLLLGITNVWGWSVFGGSAPNNAHFLTDRSESSLLSEVNLGSLSTGFLYGTVAGGVSTLSSIGSTGTGNIVLATSPTLVTPSIGAATADSLNISSTNPILTFTDTTTNDDDWTLDVDADIFNIKNITSGLTALSIAGSGAVTIATTNATGLTFGSLGTATRGIDLSGSGLSGSGDYWIYPDSTEWAYWRADGVFSSLAINTDSLTSLGNNYVDFIVFPEAAEKSNLLVGISTTGFLGVGNKTRIGRYTSCTFPTANKDYINKTGIGTGTSAVGELVHVVSGTGATAGYYRITALISADSIQVDRNIHAEGADITNGVAKIYKDVVGIFATDGTNGQRIMNYSAQNKPLQLGGDVLVATGHSLVSTDVLIAGSNLEIDSIVYFDSDIVFSQTQAAGALTGTLTNSVATGNPAIYVKVKVGASYYAVPGWLIP